MSGIFPERKCILMLLTGLDSCNTAICLQGNGQVMHDIRHFLSRHESIALPDLAKRLWNVAKTFDLKYFITNVFVKSSYLFN